MKTWLERIGILVFGIFLGILLTRFYSCSKEDIPVQADSNVTKRQEIQAKKDAKVGILEVPFKTELKPKVVYQQKADKKYYDQTVKKDLVTSMKASKSELQIFTLNPGDSLAKEWIFKNPGRQWSLVTDNGKLTLIQKDWYWRKLMATVEYNTHPNDIQDLSRDILVGAKSRLEWKDRVELELSLKHNTQNKLSLNNLIINAELNITLSK